MAAGCFGTKIVAEIRRQVKPPGCISTSFTNRGDPPDPTSSVTLFPVGISKEMPPDTQRGSHGCQPCPRGPQNYSLHESRGQCIFSEQTCRQENLLATSM